MYIYIYIYNPKDLLGHKEKYTEILDTNHPCIRGQHDSGYPALMGAPDNITVTVITARHYYELFSA